MVTNHKNATVNECNKTNTIDYNLVFQYIVKQETINMSEITIPARTGTSSQNYVDHQLQRITKEYYEEIYIKL